MLKIIHSNKGSSYDWINYIKSEFKILYDKAKILNIFNDQEISMIHDAFNKFDKY